jgi:hypothetical protein
MKDTKKEFLLDALHQTIHIREDVDAIMLYARDPDADYELMASAAINLLGNLRTIEYCIEYCIEECLQEEIPDTIPAPPEGSN